jgi:hypothetical protein
MDSASSWQADTTRVFLSSVLEVRYAEFCAAEWRNQSDLFKFDHLIFLQAIDGVARGSGETLSHWMDSLRSRSQRFEINEVPRSVCLYPPPKFDWEVENWPFFSSVSFADHVVAFVAGWEQQRNSVVSLVQQFDGPTAIDSTEKFISQPQWFRSEATITQRWTRRRTSVSCAEAHHFLRSLCSCLPFHVQRHFILTPWYFQFHLITCRMD